jgi:hypothetical protein
MSASRTLCRGHWLPCWRHGATIGSSMSSKDRPTQAMYSSSKGGFFSVGIHFSRRRPTRRTGSMSSSTTCLRSNAGFAGGDPPVAFCHPAASASPASRRCLCPSSPCPPRKRKRNAAEPWLDFLVAENSRSYDGGGLEISTDGTNWIRLEASRRLSKGRFRSRSRPVLAFSRRVELRGWGRCLPAPNYVMRRHRGRDIRRSRCVYARRNRKESPE